jgi:hypothetical protein
MDADVYYAGWGALSLFPVPFERLRPGTRYRIVLDDR